jgi:hypothetical protein
MIKTVFNANNQGNKIKFRKKSSKLKKKMRMKLGDIKKILQKSQESKKIFIRIYLYTLMLNKRIYKQIQ